MPPSPSTNIAVTSKYGIPTLLILIVAGLAGNYFKFPLFLNIDFLFGSIFALLALQLYGFGRGLLAAAFIAGYTYFLWNHPYAIIILTAEVATVYWLMARRNMGMVLADTLYWIVIGMPLVYLFYHVVMHVPPANTNIVMIKQAVNGIANALVARLLFTGYALRSRALLMSFSELVYNLLAFFVLYPALIMLALGSRSDFNETDRRIRASLIQDSQRIDQRLETWVENRKNAVVNLAEMAASRPPRQLQSFLEQAKKSDVNFLRIGLLDINATTTAFFPLADELGHKNVGRSFADSPFISLLKQTLAPMLSEVSMSMVGSPKPRVAMLAPVVISGKYGGYVIGVLDLTQIRDHLDKSTDKSSMLYTLLDKNGAIIMTNRPDQAVMTSFVRGKGMFRNSDKGISQWVPQLSHNTPASERWQKSFYVAETAIGSHSEWRLVLEQPVAPFQAVLYSQYTDKLTLLFLILLGSLLLAELLSRKVVVTLKQLHTLTRELPDRLSSGCAAVKWPESVIKEANHLIYDFREMADSLSNQFVAKRQINESLERRVEERTAQLSESEERFRSLFEKVHVVAIVLDPADGSIIDANAAAAAFYGWSQEELRTKKVTEINTLSIENVLKEMEAARNEQRTHFNFNHRRADGSVRDVEVYSGPFNAGGKEMLYSVVHDVTERKQVEAALLESEFRWKFAIEGSGDGVWDWNIQTGETKHSNRWVEMLGYAEGDVLPVNQEWADRVHPDDRSYVDKIMQDYLKDMAAGYIVEYRLRCKDDSYKWILARGIVVSRNEQGKPLRMIGTHTDISDRKRVEDELRQATVAAEAANIAKSRFLANMSHEIRTPMNAVIGLTDLLLLTELTGEQREYAELVKLSGRNLFQLISDILDHSKIEAHKIELDKQGFDLKEEATGAIKLISLRALEKGLNLDCQIDPDVPNLLLGDAGRLRQILTNLIGNAIKFTAQGSVSLHIRKDAEDEHHVTLLFSVHDSGIGIAADKLETIFEPFIQADSSTTRNYGGTGLGLSISRQLVELMGGRIGAKSVAGEGSSFWFTAVLEKQFGATHPLRHTNLGETGGDVSKKGCFGPKGGRLLLVEDDPTNQTVIKSILSKSGYLVDVANNGCEAIKALEDIDYALVLMDCMMPECNGYEATTVIRDQASAVRNHAIPVIALTANAFKEDRDSCLVAGMDDYLSKPLDIADLLAMLEKWIPSGSGCSSSRHLNPGPGGDSVDESSEPVAVDNAIFNMDEFVKRNLDDLELSHDVAAIFVDTSPEYIQAIREALAAKDAEELYQAAHRLKGAAASIALPLLHETTRSIETFARNGELEKADELLPELERRFAQAIEAIRKPLVSLSGKSAQ